MSRVDDLRKLRDAEIRVAELEDELVAAKGTDDGATHQLKADLRDARANYRTLRKAADGDAADGDAVAEPAAIEATSTVEGF